MAEVITRKCIEETRSEIDWEQNEADLDQVTVVCECGNTFDIPWDVLAFGGGFCGMYCGQCGETGKMKVIADQAKPSSAVG